MGLKKTILGGIFALVATSTLGQSGAANNSTGPLTGAWVISADFFGSLRYFRLELDQRGDRLTGTLLGAKLGGVVDGGSIRVEGKDAEGNTVEVKGNLEKAVLSGTVIQTDTHNAMHPAEFRFTAILPTQRGTAPPQRHEFTPTVFYREYSALNKPVLTVAPGDTIHTTTVDAGGQDEKGIRRVAGGNPETGPFYVETALPGDTLVVHLTRVRLNRDWAGSDDAIVESALNSSLAVRTKDNGKSIRWHLDLEKGVATPENAGEDLAHYAVPLMPMMGCIATAASPGNAAPATTDSGFFGGNMDFNEIVEGSTVYLPVQVPGALLYLGDGHAAMGDGEINGNALETSMDVEFTVDVIARQGPHGRRVETPTSMIAMGLDGSLDDAFRSATSSMASWLGEEYMLTPSEIAEVLGTAAEYKVSEVADRNSGIVLKISKERLKTLITRAK